MKRGCRAKIPEVVQCNLTAPVPGCQTERRPCATMEYDFVDELPFERIFDVDLSVLSGLAATNETNATNATEAPTLAPTFSQVPTTQPTLGREKNSTRHFPSLGVFTSLSQW